MLLFFDITIPSIFNCLWIMLDFRFNQGVLSMDVWSVAISRVGERTLLNCRDHILHSFLSLGLRRTQHRVCNASYFLDLEYLECKYLSISVQIMGVHLPVLVLTLSSLWSRFFGKRLHLSTGFKIPTIGSFGWQCNKPLGRDTVLCFCRVCSWATYPCCLCWGKPDRHCQVFLSLWEKSYILYTYEDVYIPLPYTQLYLIFNLPVMLACAAECSVCLLKLFEALGGLRQPWIMWTHLT